MEFLTTSVENEQAELLADDELQSDTALTDLADDVLYMRYKKLCAETKIKTEQAEIERLKKLKMQGELVNHATVCEASQRIGSLVRSMLRRMVYELPPVLEGLNATDMIEKLREYTNNASQLLSESAAREFVLKDEQPTIENETNE